MKKQDNKKQKRITSIGGSALIEALPEIYRILKTDLLAAYMEAHISVCYGVSSAALRDGERDIRVKILSRDKGMDASKIIEDLEAMHI